MESPGPRSFREVALLSLKGLCMGTADIIPGVSGGTIALITGIYTQLLQAIQSADAKMVSRLLHLDIKGALARLHLRFLLAIFVGIGMAIFSLARLVNYLLHNHPIFIWSLFFGLITASVIVVSPPCFPLDAGDDRRFLFQRSAGLADRQYRSGINSENHRFYLFFRTSGDLCHDFTRYQRGIHSLDSG